MRLSVDPFSTKEELGLSLAYSTDAVEGRTFL